MGMTDSMHAEAYVPGEIEHTKTVNVCLVIRRRVNAVNGRLEEVGSQSLQSITNVDGDGLVLWLDPLPLLLRVQDLKRSDRLTEQEGNTAQIGVSR